MINQLPPPGSELDQLVAERIMGWRRVEPDEVTTRVSDVGYWTTRPRGEINPFGWRMPPRYSTSIRLAWDVVERLNRDGLLCSVIGVEAGWDCSVYRVGSPMLGGGYGATAPEAICRAALAAYTDGGE